MYLTNQKSCSKGIRRQGVKQIAIHLWQTDILYFNCCATTRFCGGFGGGFGLIQLSGVLFRSLQEIADIFSTVS